MNTFQIAFVIAWFAIALILLIQGLNDNVESWKAAELRRDEEEYQKALNNVNLIEKQLGIPAGMLSHPHM